MHFSLNPSMVQGELFTETGNWKYTVQIDMSKHYDDVDRNRAVIDSYNETDPKIRGVVDGATGYWLIVQEPYHKYSYPVMVKL